MLSQQLFIDGASFGLDLLGSSVRSDAFLFLFGETRLLLLDFSFPITYKSLHGCGIVIAVGDSKGFLSPTPVAMEVRVLIVLVDARRFVHVLIELNRFEFYQLCLVLFLIVILLIKLMVGVLHLLFGYLILSLNFIFP